MTRIRVDDQVYTIDFWKDPTTSGSRRGLRFVNPVEGHGVIQTIEGIRSGERICELRFRPSLPDEGVTFDYNEETGHLRIMYNGVLVICYEYPSRYIVEYGKGVKV